MDSDTHTVAINDFTRLGYAIGALLEIIDIPESLKEIMVKMIPDLPPSALDEVYEALRLAVIEQRLVETDPTYQAKASIIDEATVTKLESVLEAAA